ncbi:hypothetical protein [Butyrivibrio sp.]|uniref:hypothetical protein n=1 Tax=Butyrivibrio sp. TaxID=28121 RepID=UPI0025C2C567|nr:hypothetical protein [Butyrivibrio sp.]MBE5839692.1 hypothetical protein [Butyrivibrio sp.]
MSRVIDILRKQGPMLSGLLEKAICKNFSVSNEAARKTVSRARSPVQKLKVFPFCNNQVFCYLEEQYNSQLYRERLYEALKQDSASVSMIIRALENSDFIMNKSLLPVFSKSPISNTKGHRNFDRIISDLIEQEVLVEACEDYYAISQMYCGGEVNLTYSKSKEQISRIVVGDFITWAGNLNIMAYNSVKVFPDEAIFAHFKWFSTVPSYITPLYDYVRKRPGFVLVDVVIKANASIEDVSFFVEKINTIRNFKKLPCFMPVLITNGVSNEAFKYLKENKVFIGVLSNLFDRKYTNTLMNMYNVLCNATAVLLKEPEKIEKLIEEIAKSEGRFYNAMGDLFECMVGLFYNRIGSKYIELNKQIPNGRGGKYEMDVLVDRDGKIQVIECKAYRSMVDKEYIEKWLSTRIPAFRRFLCDIYPNRKLEFSIWSLGGFDKEAEKLLANHKNSAKKYSLTYYTKKEIYELACAYNDNAFCDQINKHFKDYGT